MHLGIPTNSSTFILALGLALGGCAVESTDGERTEASTSNLFDERVCRLDPPVINKRRYYELHEGPNAVRRGTVVVYEQLGRGDCSAVTNAECRSWLESVGAGHLGSNFSHVGSGPGQYWSCFAYDGQTWRADDGVGRCQPGQLCGEAQ